MGRLLYTTITSIDGFTTDADGGFGWAVPSPEVHQHINDAQRGVGTYLYGRRMYEVMTYWADPPGLAEAEHDPEHAVEVDFARIWQRADKIVFSSTLPEVTTPRTTLERSFDPARVRAFVDSSDLDVGVGGPTLASHALRAGLVDEIHLYVCPAVLGTGGLPWSAPGLRLDLELRDLQRFDGGWLFLRYGVEG